MSARTRPRAPWYAALTRRLTLLRLGLPTILVCMVVVGPGLAISAQSQATKDPPGVVAQPTATASAGLGDGGRHGDGHHAREAADPLTDGR
jgi:hypothetical protein